MKHSVVHKAQTTDYTCGPTCLEMLLDFYGIGYEPDMLVHACECAPVRGTDNEKLVRAAQQLGARVSVQQNAALETIVAVLESGHPVLVNYFNCKSGVGHYAVVKGVEGEAFVLADPKNGDDYLLSFEHFEKHWHNHARTIRAWMMYFSA
jgi:ABC-type bacteriocin/lantibiotic exporter with double-glycine peptidase domain